MTNEEFQKQVMEKLESLETRMSGIENGLGGIEGRMTGIESKVAELPTRQELHAVVAEQQKDVIAMLQLLDKKLSDIQEDMKSITEIVGEHEVKIRTLIRRPV